MSAPKTTQFFESSTPVLLAATNFTEANGGLTVGQSTTPPMNQLSYPFRKPLLIEEIRFTLTAGGGLASAGVGCNLGATVFVKFMLGQMYLMRDPVPVASLGTFMSLEDEQWTAGDGAGLGISAVSHYRWRLPYPLYVEAGQYITPVFNWPSDNPPLLTAAEVNIYVSYAGRTVPPRQPRPKVIPVPYVAPWVTSLNPSGNYAQSNERHLFNPFDKPLQIQRMTGRFYRYGSFSPTTFTGALLQTGITPGPSNAQNLTVRIDDSWGGKMVNNFTGPADVWDIQRAAWTMDTKMPSKGMYLAQAWNIPSHTQLQVAMIGTREEAI